MEYSSMTASWRISAETWPDAPCLSRMGQTFFDVRNACQEHRLFAVPAVGAEDVLVPMIGAGAMLHDVTGRIHLADRNFRADPLPLPHEIRSPLILCGAANDVWRRRDHVISEQGSCRRQEAGKPDFANVAAVAGGNEAQDRCFSADLAQPDESPFMATMHIDAQAGGLECRNCGA